MPPVHDTWVAPQVHAPRFVLRVRVHVLVGMVWCLGAHVAARTRARVCVYVCVCVLCAMSCVLCLQPNVTMQPNADLSGVLLASASA